MSSCCKTKPFEKTVPLILLLIHFYPPELHKRVLKMQLMLIHSINLRQQYFSSFCWVLFKFQGYVCTCPFLWQLVLPPTVFQVKKKWTTITKRWQISFKLFQKSFKIHSFLTILTVLLLGRISRFFWSSNFSDIASPWVKILGKYKAVHAITVGSPFWLLLWLF